MKEFFQTKIIEIGGYSLILYNVISFIVFVGIVILVLFIIKRVINNIKTLDVAKKFSVFQLFKYLVVCISFIIGLHILGFNVSVLLAGSAALLVGLGFGLQNLFNDFISGVILLLDKTLKVGDIIEVNSMIYKVLEINFRTTTVLGRDENYIILPNSELTGNSVINWIHSEISSRFKVTIGVDYSTDIQTLMKVLKDVAKKNTQVLNSPEPFVRFEDYGDSALLFSIYFYTNEVFRVEKIKSDLRIDILTILKYNNITIPFPQRVLHIESKH